MLYIIQASIALDLKIVKRRHTSRDYTWIMSTTCLEFSLLSVSGDRHLFPLENKRLINEFVSCKQLPNCTFLKHLIENLYQSQTKPFRFCAKIRCVRGKRQFLSFPLRKSRKCLQFIHFSKL